MSTRLTHHSHGDQGNTFRGRISHRITQKNTEIQWYSVKICVNLWPNPGYRNVTLIVNHAHIVYYQYLGKVVA